jgi:CRP-like cAMP-binding protein
VSSPERRRLEDRLTGLAAWYLRREEYAKAERCLGLAGEILPGGFRQRVTRARLFVLQGLSAAAIEELRAALGCDPWDEDALDLLAQLAATAGDAGEAAEALADALVAAGTLSPDAIDDYGLRLDELMVDHSLPGTRAQLVDQRRQRMEGLAKQTEREAAEEPAADDSVATAAFRVPMPQKVLEPEVVSAAELLTMAGLFPGLSAADLGPLEGAVERRQVGADEAIFNEGDPSEDIFIVELGRVAISRETPFGTQALAHVEAGSVFGEMNFIDGRTRSADAIADQESRLLRVKHSALQEVFEAEPRLALAFLREFWRGLADKVREANELMKVFFEEGAGAPAADEEESQDRSKGREEGVDADEKAGVLTEQGLSGEELRRLAEVAEARAFEVEQAVFREGDDGHSLYIVLSGAVRISKMIPGVGEEALAILERGKFFGEMSLIDGSPRSATAKAHVADTRVLRISKDRLDELLASASAGAIELLSILCRLLSGRLREINDKIVQWKYMSGGF